MKKEAKAEARQTLKVKNYAESQAAGAAEAVQPENGNGGDEKRRAKTAESSASNNSNNSNNSKGNCKQLRLKIRLSCG